MAYSLIKGFWKVWVLAFHGYMVEARELEHQDPLALKVKYREFHIQSSYIHVPTFWVSP